MAAAGKMAAELHPKEFAELRSAVANLTREQLIWSSGYLAGLAEQHSRQHLGPVAETREAVAADSHAEEAWSIIYATETGNSRRVAERLGQEATAAGYQPQLIDLRDYKPAALKRETRVSLVVATHGLGDPPEGTEHFFEYLMGARAPRLEQLSFSVLALGDSSYEDFCAVGARVDERLEELGAHRLLPRVDCDLDFDDDAAVWIGRLLEPPRPRGEIPVAKVHPLRPQTTARHHDRDAPFQAEILGNQKITGRGSSKDVRHIELTLEDSGLEYLPGDSLGVWPRNPPQLIDDLLEVTGYNGEAQVEVTTETMSLREALEQRLELTLSSRGFLKAYAKASQSKALAELLEDRAALASYIKSHQIIDIVREHPSQIEPSVLVNCLRKLAPRLYSIASSPSANPDEAHLTVSVVRYEWGGSRHYGCASNFLAAGPESASVYVERNSRFRLPEDPAADIIMIGSGTGVAPFRAFVEQRAYDGARGRNWLFFGERTRQDDFLYQLEWQRYLRDGALTRLDVAFSRDQKDKFYVQHRLQQRAEDVYRWLESGAYLYVCGDAQGMAPDVQAALVEIVASQSGRTDDFAEDYLRSFKREGRYLRDVY